MRRRWCWAAACWRASRDSSSERTGTPAATASGNIGGECPDGAVAWPAILDEVIAVTAVDLPGDPGARHADEPDAVDHAPAGYAVAADWVDVAWGEATDGGTARIQVDVKNEPGSLGIVATVLGHQ